MKGTYTVKSGSKAGTQSLPTPMPMSADASTAAEIDGAPDYKTQVNGVIPGYAGHMPRSRDKYGGAATGSLAKAAGPQTGHTRPEDVLPPNFVDYVNNARGGSRVAVWCPDC